MNDQPMVIADTRGVIRFWSPGAETAFGYRADKIVGQALEQIVPEEYRAAHLAGFQRAVVSGVAAAEGQPGDFPVRSANGAIVTLPGRLTLARQASGQVIALMVVFG